MMWQPIASAPFDGTRVLLFREGWVEHTAAAYWDMNWREWITVGGNVFTGPTHWMPLPEPPK